MDITMSHRVFKALEIKKSEFYTKFNEKPLVGVKMGGDMIRSMIYFGSCLEKGLEWDKNGS